MEHVEPPWPASKDQSLSLPDEMQSHCRKMLVERGDLIFSELADHRVIYFVRAGIAMSCRHFANGLRQILGIYLPGDILNHERVTLERTVASVAAVTQVELLCMPVDDFKDSLWRKPRYQLSFLRHVAYHGMLAQEWLANLGRRNAAARTAHLLCELSCRMKPTDGMGGREYPMPLTQTDLADMLGLSVVHQNRSLKHLKDNGLVTFTKRHFTILDWEGLAKLAGFDGGYILAFAKESASGPL